MQVKEKGRFSSSKYAEQIDNALGGTRKWEIFSWNTVRTLGELEVLTRASYIMLVLVPLLAGLWPGVKVFVNQYNDSVQTATEHLHIASEKLELYLGDNESKLSTTSSLEEVTTALSKSIVHVQSNIEKVSIKSDEMPDVWAWVFLSALAAILAHTAYQVGAPPIIQQASEREYINIRIDEELKLQGGQTSHFETGDSPSDLREVVLKASEEYVYSSKTRRPIAILSLSLYAMSIVMIGIVIWSQSTNVLMVAGWIK